MKLNALFLPAFDQELRDSAERRAAALKARSPNPEELLGFLVEVFESGDSISFLAYAEAFRAELADNWKMTLRLGRALLDQGRAVEAVELMSRPQYLLKASAGLWLNLGEALAAQGRLMEAEGAATRAVYLDGKLAQAGELLARIEHAIAAHATAENMSNWRQVRTAMRTYLDLGMDKAALRLAIAGLQRLKPTEGDFEDFLAAVELLVPVGGAAKVSRHLDRITAPERYEEELRALRAVFGVLAGHPERYRLPPEQAVQFTSANLGQATAFAWEKTGDPRNAARILADYSERNKRDLELRGDLARNIGEAVIGEVGLSLSDRQSPRVINLLPFNDEIEMLRIRMDEMYDWVDQFVIVEAAQTFMGEPKPCHFEENRELFAEFADKIRYVKVEAFPDWLASAWARDFYQRDMAVRAIKDDLGPNDWVLLTDADEILREDAFRSIRSDMASLRMGTYKFFFNYRPEATNGQEGLTGAVVKGAQLARHGSSYLRFVMARRLGTETIYRSGWHFTSVKSAEAIVQKMRGYAHQEKRKARFRDRDFIDETLERIRSGELEQGWEKCELGLLPRYIAANQQLLQELLL